MNHSLILYIMERCDADSIQLQEKVFNQSISISACRRPDSEFPVPANGTSGFSSTTVGAAALAAADPLTEGVELGAGDGT